MAKRLYTCKPSIRSDAERNELVTRWLPMALRVAHVAESRSPMLRAAGREFVDDAAVDALFRAAELWDATRGKGFPSYLYQWVSLSIRSRARNHLNALARIPVSDGYDPDTVPSLPEGRSDDDDREEVDRLLGPLTGPQREALRMLYWEGLSSVACGERLGITKTGVLFRRDRALAAIRKRLASEGSGVG